MKNYTFFKRFFGAVILVFSLASAHAQYTITTSVNPANPAGGVITGAEGTFSSGQTVTLTATPNDGYEFYRWRDASGYHTENPYVFTITGNTTVRAYFNVAETRYNVSIVNGTPGSEQYVTIEGAGQKVQGGTFTVSATYSYPYNGCHWYLNGQEVSASDSYLYTNEGNGIQSDLEFTVYFDYIPQPRVITVASNNQANGSATITDHTLGTSGTPTLDVTEGDSIILTATVTNPTASFINWTLNGNVVSTEAVYGFRLPNGSGNRTYQANFVSNDDSYTMTATASPSQGGEIVSPVGGTASVAGNSSFTFTASPSTNWDFLGWYEGNTLVGSNLNYNIPQVFENRTLEARFRHQPYTVNTSVEPANSGSVTVETPNAQGTYDAGSSVTFTATPAGNYRFTGWTGNFTSSTNPYVIASINTNYNNVVAHFINTFSITSQNSHVTINTQATPYVIHGQTRYDEGANFTVEAANYDNFVFSHWIINGVEDAGATVNPYPVNGISQDMTFEPVYTPTYRVRLYKNPTNANVTLEGAGEGYLAGTQVTVRATYDQTLYEFNGWLATGTTTPYLSTNAEYTFTINGNTDLTADFTQLTQYGTVITSVVGQGTIASEQFSPVPGTASVAVGRNVTLTQQANSGWRLLRWTVNGVDYSAADYPEWNFTVAEGTTTIAATFVESTLKHVTVNTYPANDPNIRVTGLNQTGEYEDGAILSLYADNMGNDNYTFVAWMSGAVLLGNTPNITVGPIVSDTTLTAYFLVGENPDLMDYLTYDDNVRRTTVTGVVEGFRSRITTATIPSTVTSIANGAFRNCTALTHITIPAGVTSVGNYAFDGCSALTTVTLHDGLTLGEYAFHNCSSLATVTLPADLTAIPEGLFYGCAALPAVELPAGVTTIGAYAYYGCSSVYTLSLPASVQTVGAQAFAAMPGLHFVTLSAGLQSLGNDCFRNSNNIVMTDFNGDLADWLAISFGNANAQPVSRSRNLSLNGAMLTQVVVPAGVTTIKPYAFFNDTLITSITLPEGVAQVGNLAFGRLSHLERIVLLGIPGEVHADAFQAVDRENVIVEVPCNVYQEGMTWNGFTHVVAAGIPVLNLQQRPGGMVTITSRPQCGDNQFTYVISATHGVNNTFSSWSDGNTDNPRTLVLTEDMTLSPIWGRSPNATPLNVEYFDFESPQDEASWFGGDEGANKWVIGDATQFSSNGKSLYVSNDNGTHNNYDPASSPYIYSEFLFDTGYYRFSYIYMVGGNENDFMSAGLFREEGDYLPLTPHTAGGIVISDSLYDNEGGYVERVIHIDEAGWYRLAFFWTANDDDQINNPGAAIDNLIIVHEDYRSLRSRIARISVVSNNPTMGYVYTGTTAQDSINQTSNKFYFWDDVIEIHAHSNDGYRFVRWNDGNTRAHRTLRFLDIANGEIHNYTAYFEQIPDHYTVTVDLENGASEGSLQFGVEQNGQLLRTADVANGQPATVKLNLPQYGWAFLGWWNGTDTIRQNPYTYTAGTDILLIALMKEWSPCTGENGGDNYDFGNLMPRRGNFEYDIFSTDDATITNVSVYVENNQIVVEEATGVEVKLFDVNGRLLSSQRDNGSTLRIDVPASGSYMVKIGDYLTKKVVVIK